jgi:hypothetical protein
MLVLPVASLSTEFWQDGMPLQEMVQSFVPPPQLTLPGQLLGCEQNSWQLSASQRTSLMQLLGFSQLMSHAEPAHFTLPAQEFSASQCTLQLVAAPQSTPLEHEPGAEQRTWQATPSGHVTFSMHGRSASHLMMQTAPMHSPTPAHASLQSAVGLMGAVPPVVPAPPAPVPAPDVGGLPALPPLPLPPPLVPVPASASLPPEASGAEPPTASKKSLPAGAPHATAQNQTELAASARAKASCRIEAAV